MPLQRSIVEPFGTVESILVERSIGEGGSVGRASDRRCKIHTRIRSASSIPRCSQGHGSVAQRRNQAGSLSKDPNALCC